MTEATPARRTAARRLLGSAAFAQSLTVAAFGALVFAFSLRQLIGWAGYLAIIAALVLLGVLSLAARAAQIEWSAFLPVTVLTFMTWSVLSLIWSFYPSATLSSLLYQIAVAALGMILALGRDLIQLVRALGDVLRVFLTASLVMEVLVGILLDQSFPLLEIEGSLSEGGPIQGLAGERTMLGFFALFALITFGVEAATRSIGRGTAITSFLLAGTTMLFTRAPVVILVGIVLLATLTILLVLRRVRAPLRSGLTLGVIGLALLGSVTVWTFRERLIEMLNVSAELTLRTAHWSRVQVYGDLEQLNGWGWIGLWRPELAPFYAIAPPAQLGHASAASSFVDIWFQLGLIGVVVFSLMIALTQMRSLLLASRQRSPVALWPALTVTVLLVSGLFHSLLLADFGWGMLVLCVVLVGRKLSWRNAFERAAADKSAHPAE